MERLSCDLANAPVDAVKEYLATYTANRNPVIAGVSGAIAGGAAALDAVPVGAEVDFEVGWSADDTEEYPVFDRASQSLVRRREAMRVSWFVTAGELREDRTGRAEGDLAVVSGNGWTAPREAGACVLWVVLRDSRGGVDFAEVPIQVVSAE